jgi:hypothetical protein
VYGGHTTDTLSRPWLICNVLFGICIFPSGDYSIRCAANHAVHGGVKNSRGEAVLAFGEDVNGTSCV